jgi:hypothetical protein
MYNMQTNTLACYAQSPRQGHHDRALRIFGYLKHNPKAMLFFDPTDPTMDGINFEKNQDWKDIYPEAQEHIPDKIPEPMTIPLHITCFVDASHATDLITRRSVTGYLIIIGQAIIQWYSKRQNTVETSTYGS